MERARTSFSLPRSRRWSPQEARAVLAAVGRSGLPITRFAARHGLGPERLYKWQRRLGRVKASPPRFTEVAVAVPAAAAIELRLPEGITLRVTGASRLEDAVALLGRLTPR
jgi:transposase-like protein